MYLIVDVQYIQYNNKCYTLRLLSADATSTSRHFCLSLKPNQLQKSYISYETIIV